MSKVLLLCSPKPWGPGREIGSFQSGPHIGLAYIIAYLKSKGIDPYLLDADVEDLDRARFLSYLVSITPDVVGLTAFTMQVYEASLLAYCIKGFDENIKVVLGGPHATAIPEETLKEFPCFDVIVVGEGEITFFELLAALEEKLPLSAVPGIVYRNGRDICRNPARPFIKDLDSLPLPDFSLFHLERYHAFYTAKDSKRRDLPVSTSRGCPGQCIFCYKVMGTKVRYRDTDRVIDEIKLLHHKYNIEQLVFTDENFTTDQSRVVRFCERYINEGLHKKINWVIESRVDIDRYTLEMMAAANCSHITFGIESGNQTILDKNRKGISLEQSKETIKLAKELNMVVDGNFILGLPYENTNTIRDTIAFAVHSPLDYASFFILVPYPGTEANALAKEGKANLKLLSKDWRKFGKQMGGAVTLQGLSRSHLELIQMIAYVRFYLRPRRFINLFRKVDLKTIFKYFIYNFTNIFLKCR